MSTKVIFLMGAPTADSLHWDEDGLLSTSIFPFQNLDGHYEEYHSSPDDHPVKWRLLQEQGSAKSDSQNTRFLTSQDLADLNDPTTVTKDSVLDQFYNHSFTVHETSEISTPGVHAGDSMQESGLWADSTETSTVTSSDQSSGPSFLPIQGPLCDLQDLPSAEYLRSIIPQTMTVNLIVSIITIHPPRRIVTRQWRKELDLVEVVVGDETRTGFGVTFWLPPDSNTSNVAENELGKSLAGLRPRDIVLLRMVGLSSFRERVYGQSMRKGVTKVDLLHRQRVDTTDSGGLYGLRRLKRKNAGSDEDEDLPLKKVRKVREWIMRFVDSTTDKEGGGRQHLPTQRGQALPPDTQ